MGPKIPLQITPKLFAMQAYEAAQCRVKVCAIPLHLYPKSLRTCLTSHPPKMVTDSWLGNLSRPLRIESETKQDFKKTCLEQKEQGEVFHSTRGLSRKTKEDQAM